MSDSQAGKKKLPETVRVVVVGAGQAGVAASEHLRNRGLEHIVLEKSRIAESWRTRRWDSLVANGPAWHDRFPHLEFSGDQDKFVSKDTVAEYFQTYSDNIGMPVFCGVEVLAVSPLPKRPGFSVETSLGSVTCRYVIAATGSFQIPVMPSIVPKETVDYQIHSMSYKNPGQLPEGATLVVGSGSSGAQIAEELSTSGRKVFLSVGAHDRPPRSYRGRDFCWWLGVLNLWDLEAQPNAEHTTIAVSGANGGRTMDFRRLANQGITLLGRTNEFQEGHLIIGDDLKANIAHGDENYLAILKDADEFVASNGLNLPLEAEAHELLPDPECIQSPLRTLDIKSSEISSIVWATGFRNDFRWLGSTKAIDDRGNPSHKRGVSSEPGIYFLGLPWQTRRGSSFIWGVWYDAKYIADHIKKQETYVSYKPGETR